MTHIVDLITEYIYEQSMKRGGTYRFVLPSYPADVLLAIGEKLDELLKRNMKYQLRLEYGVAYRLGVNWLDSTESHDKKCFSKIKARGWYNEGDNLTSLRNKLKSPKDDGLVVILAGYDHIDDQASLQDFFHLDQISLWEICLKRSYKPWVVAALEKNKINPEDSDSDVTKIAEVFRTLHDYGLADLLAISRYLDSFDFSIAMNPTDVYRMILSKLDPFGLPSMLGLSRRSSRKAFASYIVPALGFLNYNMFIDASKRKKYRDKIIKYIAESNERELDSEILGSLESRKALLESIEDYINNSSSESLELLKDADFIYIYDRILNFKSKSSVSRKKRSKKLRGLAPEMFLRAIWLTLGELKKVAKKKRVLLSDSITEIALNGLVFRHDFEAGEVMGGQLGDEREIAHDFLRKILGGIDQFLENLIRLNAGSDDEPQNIGFQSHLYPNLENDNFSYRKSSTAEPFFKFEVVIRKDDELILRREFDWMLPQSHQVRLLVDFYDLMFEEYLKKSNALPAFSIPYMSEIFAAKDEEEVNRLIGAALQKKQCFMIDLLSAIGEGDKDEIKKFSVPELSMEYQKFISEFRENGFFAALDNQYGSLVNAYKKTFKDYIDKSADSILGPLLLKAFMVVSLETGQDIDSWIWQRYLEAAVVTPLHPTVLELIRHQNSYLCDSFNEYVSKAIKEQGGNAFSIGNWDRVTDHSKLQWPVWGIIKDADRVLDTNMKSFNYFHLLGDVGEDASFLSSRLLFQYDDTEDEEITDLELFRETQSSRLITQTINDYNELFDFTDDGISIGAYCGDEIQPVIAGIDFYLRDMLSKGREQKYSLQLTVFSDSPDDSSVIGWVNAWKERLQAAELSSGKKHYENCHISIAYRVVSQKDSKEQFKKLLETIGLDIMVFSNFIRSEGSNFELLDGSLGIYKDYRKFPVLEKACCRIVGGGEDLKRKRILSNPRFEMGSLHSEVMARIKNGHVGCDKRHIVVSQSDYKPWSELIDLAHNTSAWVVCIDPSIDEHQLQGAHNHNKTDIKREIIGFGTGVGSHGENNFTISTEQFSMAHIERRISEQVSSKLGPWGQDECDQVARVLKNQARQIAGGLSLVKATGPDRFVKELIANAIVRKLLPYNKSDFCNEVISLDAFLHWFNYSLPRPDLMRIQARIVDGYFHVNAQIVECKLAQEGKGFIEDARQQVESGLRQLIPLFKPRTSDRPFGVAGMLPDQRYWWMQLHRLIASKGQVTRSEYKESIMALERLSEGQFSIEWQAAVVAFWTDVTNNTMRSEPLWNFKFEDQEMYISVASAGKEFIKEVCIADAKGEIFSGNSKIVFEYEPAEKPDTNRKDEDSIRKEEEEIIIDISDQKEPLPPPTLPRPTSPQNIDVVKPGLEKTIPKRILLGSGTRGGRDIYWEFGHPELTNRHILVFGASGTGKTYTLQALMLELSKHNQNSLIVDYTNGFTSKQLEPIINKRLKPKQHIVSSQPLAINPFRQQMSYTDNLISPEKPSATAQRVSGVFSEVYQLGDQQKSTLYRAVTAGIKRHGNTLSLDKLLDLLEKIEDAGGPVATSASSVISKILPFVDMNPFGKEEPGSWERLFKDEQSRCHIIQLAGFMRDAYRLITEFLLTDLFYYYRTQGSKDDPKVIVLDEIQNLDHRSGSPLGQILSEGRKFGISLILATQTLSNLDKDERDRLFQASHKLFFKPADTEIRSFAQILSDATGLRREDWVGKLSLLRRGECYSLGLAYNEFTRKLEVNKDFKIKIKSLEERILGV